MPDEPVHPGETPHPDATPGVTTALDSSVAGLVKKVTTPSRLPALQTALVTTASSVGAVLLAFAICGVLLAVTGKNPLDAYQKIIDTGFSGSKLLETMDRATPMMLAAVAVAIGFKMNLFNIGVDGQFLVAMLLSAVAGAYVGLPGPLHVAFIMVVAMIVGAVWAAIAGVLKVTRGVNEVIATIMLNFIAVSLTSWMFEEFFKQGGDGSLNVKTKPLPRSAWMPEIADGLTGFFLVALGVVVVYWLLVFKSRFGFHLRASGLNAGAATTAGISSKRMIVTAIVMSGAVAGLVGLPALLGDLHAYGQANAPIGLGFGGIGVALLGRLHPVGIVAAALLFGFLDATSGPLQLLHVPSSIVEVIQAITLLTVVIVNEAVTRWMNRRTADRTAGALQLAGAPA